MAWSRVPDKGKGAPCASCKHIDCGEMRGIMATACVLCGQPINHGQYCLDDQNRLVHFGCAMKAAER